MKAGAPPVVADNSRMHIIKATGESDRLKAAKKRQKAGTSSLAPRFIAFLLDSRLLPPAPAPPSLRGRNQSRAKQIPSSFKKRAKPW